jgi:predicted lysophospholipase L1 biosynthesis ABC-type transport system permease subunit
VPFRSIGPIAVLLQIKGDPAAVQEAVRNTIAAVDPNLPLISLTSMQEAVALSSDYWPRLATGSALIAALLAVALTSLGVYGTVSNFVSRRTREIGICMALGATPADVFTGVFRQGWRAVAVGCAAGLPFALAVSMALRAFVYRVPVADPYVFVPVCLFLFLVVCAAMYLPARRATKVSPSVALRQG